MPIRYDERLSPRHYSEGATTMDDNLPAWVKVFREGLAPQLSTKGLLALKEALASDSPLLIQDATVLPFPTPNREDAPCVGACPIVFTAWQGDGINTVGELEELFSKMCYEADQRIGEPAVVRYLLNWFDDTPRDIMRAELLAEVCRALSERAVRAAPPPADQEADVDLGTTPHPRHADTGVLPAVVLVAGE